MLEPACLPACLSARERGSNLFTTNSAAASSRPVQSWVILCKLLESRSVDVNRSACRICLSILSVNLASLLLDVLVTGNCIPPPPPPPPSFCAPPSPLFYLLFKNLSRLEVVQLYYTMVVLSPVMLQPFNIGVYRWIYVVSLTDLFSVDMTQT